MEALLHQSFEIEQVRGTAPADVVADVANLHFTSIHGGIMELLGRDFLQTFYRELVRSRDVLLYVARRDSATVGFVAGTSNVLESVKNIGLGGFTRLGFAALASVWRPNVLSKVLRTTGYFFGRPAGGSGPARALPADRSELLAIAVAPETRGRGVGRSLVEALERGLQKCGAHSEYFVSTNEAEVQSNAFYAAAGFMLIGKKRHHDLMLNIYRKELGT